MLRVWKGLAVISACLLAGAGVASAASPVLSNLAAQQRAGTRLLDITYDLAADTNKVPVTLAVSTNGGATWFQPASNNLAGAIGGQGVAPGTNLLITWQGWGDLPLRTFTNLLLQLTAGGNAGVSPHLVIDLSGGAAAGFYPIKSYDVLPGLTNSVPYQTTNLLLRLVPNGSFAMGSPTGEVGRYTEETQHSVTLTNQAFYLGVFELTQAQWGRVMGTNPSDDWGSKDDADNQPVQRVGYTEIRGGAAGWPLDGQVDTNSFLGRLRARTGLTTLDLPTEAQWEYACRAGTTNALNNGKDLKDPYSCTEMDAVGQYSASPNGVPRTVPCGSYVPNPWGFYDMHGNVAEWCLDWSGAYAAGAQENPVGAASGTQRIVRGGHWQAPAQDCRSAARSRADPDTKTNRIGFRLACSAGPMREQVALTYDLAAHTLTVQGAQGGLTPGDLRVTTNLYGAVVTNTVAGIVTAGYTQAVAKGWVMTGNLPAAGATTNFVMTHTNEAQLVWLWQTNYYLTHMATTGGGVAYPPDKPGGFTNGWYAANDPVLLMGVAYEGYRFVQWRGDTNGCTLFSNVLNGTMDQARCVQAEFAPNLKEFQIISEHGVAVPASGMYELEYGTNLNNNVSELPPQGGTQYVARGWSMTGNEPRQGAGTNVQMTLTNRAVLTWLWRTNYLLSASAEGDGDVLGGTGGWYAQGAQVVLTAVASNHAHLAAWLGDTNGCVTAGNTLYVPMDQVRTLTALFVTTTNRSVTVVSARGGAMPGAGDAYHGSPLFFWVTNSPVVAGTTQYVCTGATVAGNDYTQLAPTNVALTLTNDATLTWLWQTQYRLTTTATGPGQVEGGGWYADGSLATLDAQATPHGRFVAWQGDTNGCEIRGNLLTARMGAPRAIEAVFVPGLLLTVITEQGGALPGTTTADSGTFLQFWVTNSPVVTGTTQYVCTGGTVAGNDYTSLAPTHVALTLTNDATLTWQWQTNYYLTVSAGTGGRVTGRTNDWYLSGSVATLTGVAQTGWHFVGWQGDTNGCVISSNLLTAPMHQGRALAALFGQHTVTVFSAHGGAAPAQAAEAHGARLQFGLTNSPVVTGTTQYVCTGGTVAGNDYSSLAPTHVALTLTNDATLTWQWQTNYYLTVSAGAGGSVSGSTNSWYARGTQIVLTAVAASNMQLAAWQGATNGCVVAGATLLVPMDQARLIQAVFVLSSRRVLTVISAHGGASPGTTPSNYGTLFLCAITNSPVVVGATQYVCTGAAVAGNSFTLLSPTNATILLTNHAVLTWRWATNYLLRVATNGNGSVNLPESWQAKGSSVLVVARPGAFARFGAWSGEIKGCKIKTNTLTAVMTTPRTITAEFIGQGAVTVAAFPADGGTVTGGGTADTNKTLKLSGKAKANWRFAGWADDAFLPASRTVVVAPGGQTYTARFTMATGELVLSTNRLAFGVVTVGQVATQQVTVTSLGPNPVTVKSMKLPSGCTVTPKSFVLRSSGARTNLMIVYKPTRTGALSGAVVFTSDAARGLGAGALMLTGTAVPKPLTRSAVVVDGPALVVRVVELGVPAPGPKVEEALAAVRLVGGHVQVEPLWSAGDGAITLESLGEDGDADGLPDALAAALGTAMQEGATLLTIQRTQGNLLATTPFTELLKVEGVPVPQTALPATWWLVP
jgi:formylglycine-generating enzyme required for sulfatase activity